MTDAPARTALHPGGTSAVPRIDTNAGHPARVSDYLAAEAGVRRLFAIGTGIPTASNTDEAARSVANEASHAVKEKHRFCGAGMKP